MSSTADAVAQAIDRGRISPRQYLVLGVCFILSMLEGFDVLAISFASVAIAQEFALPQDQLGLLISAGLLGMTVGALFLAALSDIFGRRRMILVALTLAGTSMVATGLAQGLWSIALLRVATGLGIGIMLATVTANVAEFAPERHRSLAVGMVTAGYPMGATLGGFASATAIGEYGWPSIFYGGGGLTLLMMLAVWLAMPESPRFLAARQPPGALDAINRTLRGFGMAPLQKLQGPAQAAARPGPDKLLTPQLRARTLWLWLCFGLCFATLYFLFGWIPKIVSDAGIDAAIAIYALTFFNLGAVAGVGGLGKMADLIGLSRMIALFLALGAALMVVFPFVDGWALMLLCAVLGALVQGGFVGLYAAAAAIYPPQVRATGVGWGIGLGRIGAVLSPYVAGVLLEQGMTPLTLFCIFAAFLLLGAGMVRQLRV